LKAGKAIAKITTQKVD